MAPLGRPTLTAFGLSGDVTALSGGQGRAYAVSDAVLVPADDPGLASWTAEVLASLPEDGFRVPRPRRRVDGRGWVADGWAAWDRAVGVHRTWDADWPAALHVAVRLHRALRAVPRPQVLDHRRDVFATADRMAWGELPLPTAGPLAGVLDALSQHRAPVDLPPQLVHGDVAGNLLWHDELPPAVIDLAPYWRPAALGLAQLVVDATLWYGADRSLAEQLLDLEPVHGQQLVLRALLFRLAIDALLQGGQERAVRWEAAQLSWDLDHGRSLAAWATGQRLW